MSTTRLSLLPNHQPPTIHSHALLRPLFKHEHGVKGTMAKRLRYYTNDDAVVEGLLHPDPTPHTDMPGDFGGVMDDPDRPLDAG